MLLTVKNYALGAVTASTLKSPGQIVSSVYIFGFLISVSDTLFFRKAR